MPARGERLFSIRRFVHRVRGAQIALLPGDLGEPAIVALQAVELLLAEVFDDDEMVACSRDGGDQLVELQMDGKRVLVLRALDQEHHQAGNRGLRREDIGSKKNELHDSLKVAGASKMYRLHVCEQEVPECRVLPLRQFRFGVVVPARCPLTRRHQRAVPDRSTRGVPFHRLPVPLHVGGQSLDVRSASMIRGGAILGADFDSDPLPIDSLFALTGVSLSLVGQKRGATEASGGRCGSGRGARINPECADERTRRSEVRGIESLAEPFAEVREHAWCGLALALPLP
jgi:hypothetical protein